jgi:hypothetical protein
VPPAPAAVTPAPAPAPSTAAPPPAAGPAAAPPRVAAHPPAEPAKPKRTSKGGLGAGFQYIQVIPEKVSNTARAQQYGLALDVTGATPIAGPVDFGTRFAWGLTDWERSARWANGGVAVGRWTNRAYVNTYNWTKKHGSDGKANPDTHGLRLMAGSMGMMFLWFGYAIAGVAFATAIVAPTTVLEANFTGNFVLSEGEVSPYLKAGIGLMAFWHPVHHNLVGGIGPNVGGGLRVGPIHLGMSGTWSPPHLHGEHRAGRSNLLTAALTVGLNR